MKVLRSNAKVQFTSVRENRMSEGSDRRRIMRIQLGTPIVAKVANAAVELLDISARGARIQHAFPLDRAKEVRLSFSYMSRVVEIGCSIVRSKYEQRSEQISYFSGLRFIDREDGSLDILRDIIAAAVSEDFEARRKHLAKARRQAADSSASRLK